tara:strand:- start:47 stop:331 length:285 start_codon:yes stop_codon:yes gene_type:complete
MSATNKIIKGVPDGYTLDWITDLICGANHSGGIEGRNELSQDESMRIVYELLSGIPSSFIIEDIVESYGEIIESDHAETMLEGAIDNMDERLNP